MAIVCYSRRIMAPFQGTLQAIRAGDAEAECRDGITWIIYLTSEDILAHTGMNEIRYGTWSSTTGLVRSRIQGSPISTDHRDMLDEIVLALEENAEHIPFPGVDHYEQWLLSKHDRAPIALLNTAIDPGEFNPNQSPYDWRPSQNIMEHFRSRHGEVHDLITSMKSQSAIRPKAIWIKRDKDGEAHDLSGAHLSDMRFPDTPVQAECFAGVQRKLVDDYLDFDAPAMLQLLTIPRQLRARLEQAAWAHPLQVASLYRLYPYIIDKEGLKVALVKASIIGISGNNDSWHEPFLPYVNE